MLQLIAPRFVPLLMQHFPLRGVRGLGGKLGHQLEEMLRQLEPPVPSLPPSVPNASHLGEPDPQSTRQEESAAEKKSDITAQAFIDKFSFDELVTHLGHETAAFVVQVCAGDDGGEPVNEKKVEVKAFSAVKQFDQRSGDALVRIEQLGYWVHVLCEEIILRCEDERVENKRFPMQLTLHSTRVGEKPKTRKLRIAQTTTVDELYTATMALLRRNVDAIFPCAAITMHAKDFVALDSAAVASISSYFTKQQQPMKPVAATDEEETSEHPVESKHFAMALQKNDASSSAMPSRDKKKISSFFQPPVVVATSAASSGEDSQLLPSTTTTSTTEESGPLQLHAAHPGPRAHDASTAPFEDAGDAFAHFRSTVGGDGKHPRSSIFYCDRCLRSITETRAEHQDFHFALELSRSEPRVHVGAAPLLSAPGGMRGGTTSSASTSVTKKRKTGPLDAFLKR